MIMLDETLIQHTNFPDKTTQVWKLPLEVLHGNQEVRNLVWRFHHEDELIQVAQIKTLLSRYNYVVDLHLPYLPYGRQDKPVQNDATFGLTTFATLINALDFNAVWITDPHSDRALSLIKNSKAVYPLDRLNEAYLLVDANVVFYPDQGAYEKYSKVYFYRVASHGVKERNQKTGEILSYSIPTYFIADSRIVLIVDDICDGGETFKRAASLLYEAGVKDVHLFVTNGIFSNGVQTLIDSGIRRIFTQYGEVKLSEVKCNI